jgi:hypothetical protein
MKSRGTALAVAALLVTFAAASSLAAAVAVQAAPLRAAAFAAPAALSVAPGLPVAAAALPLSLPPEATPAAARNLSAIEQAAAPDLQRLAQPNIGAESASAAGANIAASLTNLRTPSWEEQNKLNIAANETWARNAPITKDLHEQFVNRGGRVLVDQDRLARYHARASANPADNVIAMTVDAIGAEAGAVNGSWASIQSLLAREQTHFYPDYAWNGQTGLPPSAEKLAMAYAYMAMCFAELTNGSARAWSTNLDIRENNKAFIWGHYHALLEAAQANGFIATRFFTFLRDTLARQVSANPAYQYSLYEMNTGLHWRPDTALHQTPIPANVPRLNDAQYQQASQKIYGADGEGDINQPKQTENFLGFIKSWFTQRGNI